MIIINAIISKSIHALKNNILHNRGQYGGEVCVCVCVCVWVCVCVCVEGGGLIVSVSAFSAPDKHRVCSESALSKLSQQ